jgi:tRNA pseudouridine55 synthase
MRRRLDGVLLLDKPAGLSSNAALQRAKRLYGAAKAGHAGTLDPLASGLLQVLIGEATKFSQLGLDSNKAYEARAQLGVTTTTADAEGDVLERRECAHSQADIEPALARFRGGIDQVPPMHSALKRDGRPLYALAREGREVPRAPRRIQIHVLELSGFGGDWLELRVVCSKGTYIRTLVEDIGAVLACGAHLAALRRVAAGGFSLENAISLADLEAASDAERDARLLPVDSLLSDLPRVDLPEALAVRFSRGQTVTLGELPQGSCSVYAGGGQLLGLGEGGEQGALRPRRLVNYASG